MQLLPQSKPRIPLFQSQTRPQNPSKPLNVSFCNSPSRQHLQAAPRATEPPSTGEKPEKPLVVRKPVIKPSFSEEVGTLRESDDEAAAEVEEEEPPSGIEMGLNKFAKKMGLFAPKERVSLGPEERPLKVNLELALYRAKVFAKNFQFKEAEEILRKCMFYWPDDGRAYVALGKYLIKQYKYDEAKVIYEEGCQATQGENSYIWQCWAVLENKLGNIKMARDLFDASIVADKKHVAAWHGWAFLEIKEGNIEKARDLLAKGMKYCEPNEYIYQTLALLEARANRFEQARYLFQRATFCNPKSCASWLAWAQLEMQLENRITARTLFEKAVQASPKNRFAWHVWALFEASQGDIDKARKLLKIGHSLNPRDPVLVQSMALLEYKHSSADLARALFRKASQIDPKHQPVWNAWGWVEWKEGNIAKARELYQKTLSIDPKSETAARCFQAWGVLEERLNNLSTARRLFRASVNINSQNYVTWKTWATLEEKQGNDVRAEEIRNLYFQQRTEVVDDESWVMSLLDVIDPAVDSIKRFLKLNPQEEKEKALAKLQGWGDISIRNSEDSSLSSSTTEGTDGDDGDDGSSKQKTEENDEFKSTAEAATIPASSFDLDTFIREKLSLDASKLDDIMLDSTDIKRTETVGREWNRESRKISFPP